MSGKKKKAAQPVLRLKNLVKSSQQIGERLAQLASISRDSQEAECQDLLADIQNLVQKTEALCIQAGAQPFHLPLPSRRAYAWLRFLSAPDNFERHVSAERWLADMLQNGFPHNVCPEAANRKALHIRARFYNLPVIYKLKQRGNQIELVIGEPYIAAPQEILQTILCAALARKTGKALASARSFARTDAYERVYAALNAWIPPESIHTKGAFHDLQASFDRVNRTYFQNQLTQPYLTWSARRSWRKLGHYDPLSDVVQITRSLDAPGVPAYIVDFVMYHELLHKSLGVHQKGSRRYSHTAEFRKAERAFHQFEPANEFLKAFARSALF